jgi:hypothetical protein
MGDGGRVLIRVLIALARSCPISRFVHVAKQLGKALVETDNGTV